MTIEDRLMEIEAMLIEKLHVADFSHVQVIRRKQNQGSGDCQPALFYRLNRPSLVMIVKLSPRFL